MLAPFFILAAQSPGRRSTLDNTIVAHLVVLAGAAWASYSRNVSPLILGNTLLIAGIVEGAFLLGWRLSQMPKSQSLEFLLVTPLRPRLVFIAEALVGLSRLVIVNLTGLPILALLTVLGRQEPGTLKPLPPALLGADLVPLILMPITWGAVTGLGLITWAYEPKSVRRWAERVAMAGIVFYLVVGVLVAENLGSWLTLLPEWVRPWIMSSFLGFHLYNPFGVVKYWFENFGLSVGQSEFAWEQFFWLELAGLGAVGLFMARAASRLQGHFHERHYSPAVDESSGPRGQPGEHPLSWWAVRRVTEYSGRVNLWLAAGFGIVYAVFTVAESVWPPWLGRGVFTIVERAGGIPGVTTALVVLAAVPAAFQYGLWDSNIQERCRRLELLLLTQLSARDYWNAAAAAAWRRGRGYFYVAVLLWAAAGLAGKATVLELLVSLSAGVILWALYFVLGFRAFARGLQANGFGILLTVGLPLCSYALYRGQWPALAALLPPGSIYAPVAGLSPWFWVPGPLLGAVLSVVIARRALAYCEEELRHWYELYHGSKGME